MKRQVLVNAVIAVAGLAVAALLVVVMLQSGGTADPGARGVTATAAGLDIGVLVFREGLECILVLAALSANMTGARRIFQRPVLLGVLVGLFATLLTWQIAVRAVDGLSESMPALHVQALTGLVAVIVLVIVMNWFFHKVYWTGWMSLHSRKKQDLLRMAGELRHSRYRIWWGLGVLGFASLYREGFEVVLFLQSYRLKLGDAVVGSGVTIGVVLTLAVAVLTFVAQRKLPYRKMLVLTGVLLGGVLLVMVGEQAQEMQLAHWLPTTKIPALENVVPAWMGLWFAIFPTVETLAAQGIAGALVLGSYLFAERGVHKRVLAAQTDTSHDHLGALVISRNRAS